MVTSKTKKKGKGKGRQSPLSSGGNEPPIHSHDHHHDKSSPLPHEEDAGPSGFGTANEDYNTLTEEYLEAAEHTGYDGKVKNIENEGPLVEGSNAWEEAHNEEGDGSSSTTPNYIPVDGSDEFRNVWGGLDHAGPEGKHL